MGKVRAQLRTEVIEKQLRLQVSGHLHPIIEFLASGFCSIGSASLSVRRCRRHRGRFAEGPGSVGNAGQWLCEKRSGLTASPQLLPVDYRVFANL